MKKLEIKKSKIDGKGVFTKNKIKKGKKVFKFANRIITIYHKEGCNCNVCCRCINVENNLWLYPYKNSFGWNLNHSCNPNCYSRSKSIYALKKIPADAEITIDYSTTTKDKVWNMKCSCNSIHCRKIIQSIQFIPRTLFTQYKPYMQPFIKNSYLS